MHPANFPSRLTRLQVHAPAASRYHPRQGDATATTIHASAATIQAPAGPAAATTIHTPAASPATIHASKLRLADS